MFIYTNKISNSRKIQSEKYYDSNYTYDATSRMNTVFIDKLRIFVS